MKIRNVNFAIVGAQKAATTSVHEALMQAFDVYMPMEEIRAFEDPEYGQQYYEDFMARISTRDERLIGIKRPDYLAREEVPSRLYSHAPDMKIVAILREPVSRLLSAYYYYMKLGFLPVQPLNEGLPKIMDNPGDYGPKAKELLDYGLYDQHLSRYFEIFPSDSVHVSLQDDLVRDQNATIRLIADFVGVDLQSSAFNENKANEGVCSITRLKWLTRRNKYIYRYDGFGKIQERSKGFNYIPAYWITTVDRVVLSRLLGNEKEKLSPALKERLAEFYLPSINNLERLIGRDFGAWSSKLRAC